jgi:dTDP-4-dehydrorhamnose 3,5-epimerase
MKVTPLLIPEVLIIEPTVFHDHRGFLYENFNLREFKKATKLDVNFVQENLTKSFQGVLRGLHYQLPPHAQGKFVSVIQGEIFDVAVDIRKDSATYGKYVAQILSADNKKQMWIPEGFAHGFLTLSKTSEFLYKTTDFYHPETERCILWNDVFLNIKWPEDLAVELSSKDLSGMSFDQVDFPY